MPFNGGAILKRSASLRGAANGVRLNGVLFVLLVFWSRLF